MTERYVPDQENDVLSAIDELVNESLDSYDRRTGYDYNAGDDTCPNCYRNWHGLPKGQCPGSHLKDAEYDAALAELMTNGPYEPKKAEPDGSPLIAAPASESYNSETYSHDHDMLEVRTRFEPVERQLVRQASMYLHAPADVPTFRFYDEAWNYTRGLYQMLPGTFGHPLGSMIFTPTPICEEIVPTRRATKLNVSDSLEVRRGTYRAMMDNLAFSHDFESGKMLNIGQLVQPKIARNPEDLPAHLNTGRGYGRTLQHARFLIMHETIRNSAESELEMISEEYWEAVRDLSNLRCLYCSQPYGERDEITCRIEGTAHTYDSHDVETHKQIVAGIEPRYKNAKSDYCERKVKFNHEVKHCAGVHDWRHADYGDGIIGHVCAKCPEMRGPFKSTLEVK